MKYLRLEITNIEPLCISDDSTSQSGQTKCYKYIPGTTLRGYVINCLSKDESFFAKHKKTLFSPKIRFLNAYPGNPGEELIPSLKGFYEKKKADGTIRNVVTDGEFDEGMKRAGLGTFCRIEGDTVRYSGVETDSVMKILIDPEDQKIFRGEYIVPGYHFTGHIVVEDEVEEELVSRISDCFKNRSPVLGNRRSQGFGKCRVSVESGKKPLASALLPSEDLKGSVYMILLSDMTMLDKNGEYSGLDLDKLADKMGVEELTISHCATSMVSIHGYNSTFGVKLPTVPMYEKGSVFKLTFSGCMRKDIVQKLFDKGIGERRSEGFGRVLFVDERYEALIKKVEDKIRVGSDIETDTALTDEDRATIKTIAGFYYRKLLRSAKEKKIPEDKAKMRITKSQAGTVLSILEKNRYNSDVKSVISKYFSQAEEKEDNQNIQKERVSIKGFSTAVQDMLTADSIGCLLGVDVDSVMGYKTEELITPEESQKMIVGYVIDLIKYAGKEK